MKMTLDFIDVSNTYSFGSQIIKLRSDIEYTPVTERKVIIPAFQFYFAFIPGSPNVQEKGVRNMIVYRIIRLSQAEKIAPL